MEVTKTFEIAPESMIINWKNPVQRRILMIDHFQLITLSSTLLVSNVPMFPTKNLL